jgi:hypothetical protein
MRLGNKKISGISGDEILHPFLDRPPSCPLTHRLLQELHLFILGKVIVERLINYGAFTVF